MEGNPGRGDHTQTCLYESPRKALESLVDHYNYWTSKVTESSFALSLAVIGANWAVFGSLENITKHPWAEWSLGLVVASLGISLFGYWLLGELVRRRISYGEENPARWVTEFENTRGKNVPWPSTKLIDRAGIVFRFLRMLLPIAGGAFFLMALLDR